MESMGILPWTTCVLTIVNIRWPTKYLVIIVSSAIVIIAWRCRRSVIWTTTAVIQATKAHLFARITQGFYQKVSNCESEIHHSITAINRCNFEVDTCGFSNSNRSQLYWSRIRSDLEKIDLAKPYLDHSLQNRKVKKNWPDLEWLSNNTLFKNCSRVIICFSQKIWALSPSKHRSHNWPWTWNHRTSAVSSDCGIRWWANRPVK